MCLYTPLSSGVQIQLPAMSPPSISGLNYWSNPPPPPQKKKKKKKNFYDKHIPSVSFSEDIPPHLLIIPIFSFCSSTFPFLSFFFLFGVTYPPPLLTVFLSFFGLSTPPPFPYFYLWPRFYMYPPPAFPSVHCHTLVWTASEPTKPPPRLYDWLRVSLPLPFSIFGSH